VASYPRVVVDAVVDVVVMVLVEEGCCSPWQTYCASPAAPSLPSPNTRRSEKIPQEKGKLVGPKVVKFSSDAMLFFASVKHAAELLTSS